MKKYWISWASITSINKFEMHFPWWVSGFDGEGNVYICAAIIAANHNDAWNFVIGSYNTNKAFFIERRFCIEKSDSWSPFNDRFQRAAWMLWPEEVKK